MEVGFPVASTMITYTPGVLARSHDDSLIDARTHSGPTQYIQYSHIHIPYKKTFHSSINMPILKSLAIEENKAAGQQLS